MDYKVREPKVVVEENMPGCPYGGMVAAEARFMADNGEDFYLSACELAWNEGVQNQKGKR